MKKLRKISILIFGLLTLPNVILFFFGDKLPVEATNILSLAYFLHLPLILLLNQIGITTLGSFKGEYWGGPSPLGIIISAIIYSSLFFFIGRWVLDRKQR